MLSLPLTRDPPKGSVNYSVMADISNFTADKAMLGQRLEASALRAIGNSQGYTIKGDVKINGVPAALDYRRPRGDADAEIRVVATLDDAQVDALRSAGCTDIYEEHASGGDQARSALARALTRCKAGDVLVVTKIDRLAR